MAKCSSRKTSRKGSRKGSRKASRKGSRRGANAWIKAVTKARKDLGIVGFCAVKKGTPLYKHAKKLYEASK